MSYFLPKGDYVMMYVILCISIHMMLIVLFICFPVTFFVNGNFISIEVLPMTYTSLPLPKEQSYALWHKRFGHISKDRVERLIKTNILPALKNDLETCVDCCRGKMTKIRKKIAVRSSDLLEVIHIDISGPYTATLCRNFYFITFIDDYYRYGYLYLIKEKAESLDKFKIRTEVEKQLGKVIKVVRSDRGGEYYGKHGNVGQLMTHPHPLLAAGVPATPQNSPAITSND